MKGRIHGQRVASIKNQSTLIILSFAILLPLFSDANTYEFKPTKHPANYSDTANWVNRDYPGRQIAYGDTITFETNATFNTAIIDSSILVKGFCQIGDEVHWIVPLGVTATFQRDINDGMILEKISSANTSSIQIEGVLRLYACDASFDGVTNITGTISADAEYNFVFGLWQTATFNDISVSGSFTGTAVRMYCDSLFVNAGARVAISSGYEFNNGSLHVDTVYNKGEISLQEETQMQCNYIHNEGQLKAGYLSGKLHNSGAIEIVQKPTNSFTANLFDVVNSGSVQLYGSVYAPIFLNGVNNTGIFQVADYLNETSTVPWLTVNGAVFNSNQWIQSGNVNTAEMFGEMTNTGAFGVSGKTNFNSGTFTNNGSCNFYNPAFDFGIRIRNQFINNANLSIYGPLEITGQLYNHGNMTIRP